MEADNIAGANPDVLMSNCLSELIMRMWLSEPRDSEIVGSSLPG